MLRPLSILFGSALVFLLMTSAFAQEQILTDSSAVAQGVVGDTTSAAESKPNTPAKVDVGLSLDTIWKMTEQGGGLRYPIYLVFIIGVGAIIFKIVQLMFDSKFTRPFIKQKSEGDEAALQAETQSQTLKNMLAYKVKSHSPQEIVALASRYPKSKVAALLRSLGELASRTKNAVAFQEEISGFVRREKDRFAVWQNFVFLMSDTAGALGLVGTVWGMYTTFIGGNLQPEQILTGMGIALVTTLLGLIVSIVLNIFATGVVKMFSNRVELIEYAGDVFRSQFAEGDAPVVAHAGAVGAPAPVVQQYVAPQPAAGPELNPSLMNKRVATKLEVLSGDGQVAEVNSQLPRPIELQVLDQDEEGMPKQKVVFEVNGSDCSFGNGKSNQEVATDSRGKAKINLTLGKLVGEQSVTAMLKGENGNDDLVKEIIFVSKPGPPEVMTALPDSNHQSGLLKERLGNDLAVKVEDRFGNPITDTPIAFRVVSNDVITNSGRFENRKSEIEVMTDERGIAATPFWLGEDVGPNVVRVTPKTRGGSSPEFLFYANGKDN